ncbi:MAG TPA: translation initiation factor IF-2 [Fervidobacterium sp.]|nr:translation initiation factor IF-2 [Fervidobacterium sp.]
MARLRVYELAKQLDMGTKELLHELEELGIEVRSHMSYIDEETVNILLDIYKQTLEEEEEILIAKQKESIKEKAEVKKPPIHITEQDLRLDKLAEKIKIPQNRIIQDFFMKGEVLRPGQQISVSLVKRIAKMYEVRLTFEEEETTKETIKTENPLDDLKRKFDELYVDKSKLSPRPPVVTVMGHVDHGKTTLLDHIRKTRVAEKEEGGITQSIGAYQVLINGKKITFIDTPGHEVFTEMRARGAQSTDIVVLVVAADDGVMPQTIEAYNHAKSANVPVIVAINKIDKPNANVDMTKQDLVTKLNLIPEDWGGDTIVVPISARNGINVDTLLEMILLVAEMQDIRCIPDSPVRAITIETKLDKGYGPVANAIVRDGILRVGDYIVAGKVYGKVKALIDDKGKRIREATPSTPVMIVGFEELPDPHSIIYVVDSKEAAVEITDKVREIEIREMRKKRQIKLEEILKKMQETEKKEVRLILKADTVGSLQALQNAIVKLRTNEIDIDIVHSAVGAINSSDVMLASASEAIILGFRVKADTQTSKLAESEGIQIRTYTIIYKLLEDLKAALEGMLEPEEVEEKTGTGEIMKVFKIHRMGNIAGVQLYDGYVEKSGFVRIYRNGALVFEGKMETLKHYQQDVTRVNAPQECGIKFLNFDDIREKDEIEFYITKKVPRKLTTVVDEDAQENQEQ